MRSDDRSAQITLRALVMARWVLLGLLGAAGGFVMVAPELLGPLLQWFPQAPAPGSFFGVLAVWLLANVVTQRAILATGRATRRLAGIHLLVDATVVTVLLGISGGPANPFTTLYFVPITLATQVSPRWTWALAGYCLVGFASLFVVQPLPAADPMMQHGAAGGHQGHFAGHLRGMWVAFGISGALITYFVHRIALSLARQRQELANLREQAMQDRNLAAVGTLAAGAAHELGTPLGSIQLLVSDLAQMNDSERAEAVSTVRQELRRCKDIVHRMASPQLAVQSLGADGIERWPVTALVSQAQTVADMADVRLVVEGECDVALRFPREPLEQIVRELVTNAVDACQRRGDGKGSVTFAVRCEGDELVVEVRDEGIGMAADVVDHAFEPFYSTKDEGEGMGLGLYLARAQLRQLGGSLRLQSEPGRGTTLAMTIPIQPVSSLPHVPHDPARR